ncbi:MAG: site-2 protease family protein [bacterium]
MLIQQLFTNPVLFLAWAVALVIAISFHEFSHAAVATILGDSTAKRNGRLTLNPFAHLDLWGTILLLVAGFGWGKPVPFNPFNLKNQKWGPALISLAGPISNLFLVIVFILIIRILGASEVAMGALGEDNMLFIFLQVLVILNTILMVFNLIPIPPLDGSKVMFAFFPAKWYKNVIWLEKNGPLILIGFIIIDSVMNLGILSTLFQFVLSQVNNLIIA